MDLRSTFLARTGLAQLAGGHPAAEIHLPGMVVAPNLDVELLAERVDAADTDAVQAARNLVGGGIELAASMELGEHDFDRGHLLAVGQSLHVRWNAAPVVDHRNRVVHMDDDVDLLGVAGEGFVDGVVDDLIDEMVEAHFAGGSDVHGRTQPDSLEALEDFDVLACIAAVVGEVVSCKSRHRIPFARFSLSGPRDLGTPFAFWGGTETRINRLKYVGFERIRLTEFYHAGARKNGLAGNDSVTGKMITCEQITVVICYASTQCNGHHWKCLKWLDLTD